MLIDMAYSEFHLKNNLIPKMSLRSGNAIDGGREKIEFDSELDKPTNEYLESNYDGICYLDSESWKYYLPILIEFAINNYTFSDSMVIDSFISSLKPPDREPPRLGSLSDKQENIIVEFLDKLAFDEQSNWKTEAMLALEEYWAPGALYKDSGK